MEMAPGIHRIDTELGTRLSSLYLVVGDDDCLLFDTGVDGTAQRELASYLSDIGVAPGRIRWAVVSHADVDHFGGLASVAELVPGANLVAHALDAPLIEDFAVYETRRGRGFREPWGLDEEPASLAWARAVTREGPLHLRVRGGERIRLGAGREVELLHVPGHSLGHLALLDRHTGSLVVADAVLGDAVRHADGRPAFPPTYRYVDSYLSTIGRLEALSPDLLLTAHYPTMDAAAAAEFLALSRAFVDRVDEVVLDEVAASDGRGLTLRELLARANPRLGDWPQDGTIGALAFPVVGHLERMLGYGRITLHADGDGPPRVRSAA